MTKGTFKYTCDFKSSALSVWSAINETVNQQHYGKTGRKHKTVLGKCGNSVKCAVHIMVHEFFFKTKHPHFTVLPSSDPHAQNFKRTCFHTLLLEIGFTLFKREKVQVCTSACN